MDNLENLLGHSKNERKLYSSQETVASLGSYNSNGNEDVLFNGSILLLDEARGQASYICSIEHSTP